MSQIRLYGNNHSPWAQAVMMGLHQKNLSYSRTAVPPLDVFLKWGTMMPAISVDHGPWELESKEILHKLGFSEVSTDEIEAVRRTWQGRVTQNRLLAAVLGRIQSGE